MVDVGGDADWIIKDADWIIKDADWIIKDADWIMEDVVWIVLTGSSRLYNSRLRISRGRGANMESIDNNSQQSANGDQLLVEMCGIVKRFPGVLANDHVDFELRRGEIHALLGENGAGKSTLMNVLAGLYHPEAGEMYVAGELVSFSSPRDAIDAGIGMVHQHFMLVPSQTVTENILLGLDEPRFRVNLSE